ncbi:hypothetical protein E3W21_02320 [Pseudomonas sp. F01002]|nr:hypothetical protein E3W21_02320 [Pseudomonas sp. F01002]
MDSREVVRGKIGIWKTCSNPVGASLLAIAIYHSTSLLNVKPLSRASSLPQGNAFRQANSGVVA